MADDEKAVVFADLEGRDVHGFLLLEDLEDEAAEDRLKREQLATFEREVWNTRRRLNLAETYPGHGVGDPDVIRSQLAAAEKQYADAGGVLEKVEKRTARAKA